jgi:hypothetical protein
MDYMPLIYIYTHAHTHILCTIIMTNIKLKRERSRKSRDTNLTWFSNVLTSIRESMIYSMI